MHSSCSPSNPSPQWTCCQKQELQEASALSKQELWDGGGGGYKKEAASLLYLSFFFFCNQEFALGLVGPTLSSRNSSWASRETT